MFQSEIYEVKDCTYIDNYTNYGSASCVQSTTNDITTLSTQNNTYAVFTFSRTSSLSSAIYINSGECFEFTIVDVGGTVTVRGDKSDGTAVGLFNSNSNPSYFTSGNQIRLEHTGDAMKVYINNTLTKTVALTDNRRLAFRLEDGATFSFKDLITYPV